MREAAEPIRPQAKDVAFELDRFELASSGRVEVGGRWFGVRGRRFVRPTLTVAGDGVRSRSLADLEHKPWSPDEGQPWIAAFPWEFTGEGVEDVELAVAPDIAVALPPPRGTPPIRRPRRAPKSAGPDKASDDREQTAERPRRRGPSEATKLRRELGAVTAQLATVRRELEMERDVALGARDGLLAERDGARTDLDRIRAERDAAVGERDAAMAERDALAAERDALIAERDALAAERDAVLADRVQSASQHDGAIARRDEAMASRDEAWRELDAARRALDQAVAEREAAMKTRDEAAAERDKAFEIGREAWKEREAAMATLDLTRAELETLVSATQKLQGERDEAMSSRGAALVMRNATLTVAREGREAWVVRAGAIVLLVAALVAILLVLKVL